MSRACLWPVQLGREESLTRVLRDKITSGEYKRGYILWTAHLSDEHNASVQVVLNAPAMLTANRYVDRPGKSGRYRVM